MPMIMFLNLESEDFKSIYDEILMLFVAYIMQLKTSFVQNKICLTFKNNAFEILLT